MLEKDRYEKTQWGNSRIFLTLKFSVKPKILGGPHDFFMIDFFFTEKKAFNSLKSNSDTQWKLRNFAFTVFSQKFRQIDVLPKNFTID